MGDRNVVDTGVVIDSGADDCGAFVSGSIWGCSKDGLGVREFGGVRGPGDEWALSDICIGRRFVVAGPAVVVTCT